MNQDNMDPETMNQADPDEEEINAEYMKAHKMNATYDKMNGDTEKGINAGYMKSSYHVNASYHKESVEDLYPELMEGKSSPKPLSIIRQNKVSSDAVEEKMVMCEHCGKMHEEGGCAQSAMDMNDMDPETKGMEEAKAPRLSSSHKNQIHKISRKHSGNMEKAIKEIEKMKIWAGQGIKDNPYVMDVLRQHNEDVNEGVDVDRRTKGFKYAMIRQEKAKKVREKYKKKKEAKKDQAELDARYDYDGEVDTVLAAANYVLAGGKNEDAAANAVAHGGVDMAPNAGKKKKKKNLMARKY